MAVVLSCHSEYIGEMFIKAGVDHVIWVGREYEIKDSACVKFAKTFYKSLFDMSSKTIWDAFELAKNMIKIQFGKEGNRGKFLYYIHRWGA